MTPRDEWSQQTRPRSTSVLQRLVRRLRLLRARWASLTTSERRVLLLVGLALVFGLMGSAGLSVGSTFSVVVFWTAGVVALYRAGVHGSIVKAVSDDA